MNTYKFETTVHDEGILIIPEIKKLVNHKIDIIIVDKSEEDNNKSSRDFTDFSKRWAGFLKSTTINDWKEDRTDYLKRKYK